MGIFINLIVVLEMIPEIAEAGPPQICSFRCQLDFFIPSFVLWEHLRKSFILGKIFHQTNLLSHGFRHGWNAHFGLRMTRCLGSLSCELADGVEWRLSIVMTVMMNMTLIISTTVKYLHSLDINDLGPLQLSQQIYTNMTNSNIFHNYNS